MALVVVLPQSVAKTLRICFASKALSLVFVLLASTCFQTSSISLPIRAHARCQRYYCGWVAFKSNPIAMLGLAIVVGLVLMAIFAPWITSSNGLEPELGRRLLPMSSEHWFGTDHLGQVDLPSARVQKTFADGVSRPVRFVTSAPHR